MPPLASSVHATHQSWLTIAISDRSNASVLLA